MNQIDKLKEEFENVEFVYKDEEGNIEETSKLSDIFGTSQLNKLWSWIIQNFTPKEEESGLIKSKPTNSGLVKEVKKIEKIVGEDIRFFNNTVLIDKLWRKQCEIIDVVNKLNKL